MPVGLELHMGSNLTLAYAYDLSKTMLCICISDSSVLLLAEVTGKDLMAIQSSHMIINNHGYVVPFKHNLDN